MTRANTTQSHQALNFITRQGFFSGPKEVVVPRVVLALAVTLLTAIGLIMVYSSSTVRAISEGSNPAAYFLSQARFALGGLILCVILGRVFSFDIWRTKLVDVVWGVSVVLLFLTAVIGTSELGAQRWLSLGGISFQPSELAKVALLLMMSRIMARLREEDLSFGQIGLAVALLILGPLGLLYKAQSDLGTTLICLVGILTVVLLADIKLTSIFAMLGAAVFFALLAVFGKGYRSDRMVFLNPYDDYYGTGFQLIHSFYAFADGGLFGVGIGNSAEKYLYLPEAHTDFIFAILGEEMGLIGALLVVALFLVILFSGLHIARQAPDRYSMFAAGGATVMLVFQAFLNICCVIGLLPTTGKPLPFISAGGSSLLGSFLLVALILSVSMASGQQPDIYTRRRQNLKVVRAVPGVPAGGIDEALMMMASRGKVIRASREASARRNTTRTTPSRNDTRSGTRRTSQRFDDAGRSGRSSTSNRRSRR